MENILVKEREAHRNFFGQEFDLANFRAVLERHGPEAISRFQELGMEPHFLPPVMMWQEVSFPGWKEKPNNWYYEQVAAGKVFRRQPDGSFVPDREAFNLDGITVLVAAQLKPQYKDGTQMFKDDNLLGPIIERLRREQKIAKYQFGPQSSRFGTSANEWEEYVKPALAEFLGVEVFRVMLEPVIVANVIPQLYPHMPRRNDGKTSTCVWYKEYFMSWGSCRLRGGDSDYGGLSHVYYTRVGAHWSGRAIRPLVVLGG